MIGRVALVTGGSSGIGLATARALLEAGADVSIVARRPERLAAARDDLLRATGADTGRVTALAADVASEAGTAAMVRELLDLRGRIDVLVHAAGVLRATVRGFTPFVDLPLAEWRAVLDTNLAGTFHVLGAVLPAMIAAGSGDVVHVSSRSGLGALAFDGPYAASKFAARGLLHAWAEEVAPHGVRLQSIAPGAFATELLEQSGTPSAGLPPPERVAATIVAMLALPRDVVLEDPIVEGLAAAGGPTWGRAARTSSVALTGAWTRALPS